MNNPNFYDVDVLIKIYIVLFCYHFLQQSQKIYELSFSWLIFSIFYWTFQFFHMIWLSVLFIFFIRTVIIAFLNCKASVSQIFYEYMNHSLFLRFIFHQYQACIRVSIPTTNYVDLSPLIVLDFILFLTFIKSEFLIFIFLVIKIILRKFTVDSPSTFIHSFLCSRYHFLKQFCFRYVYFHHLLLNSHCRNTTSYNITFLFICFSSYPQGMDPFYTLFELIWSHLLLLFLWFKDILLL